MNKEINFEVSDDMEFRRVSVIVPCFNESRTIGDNLRKIKKYLADNFSEFEIIAVDDGSRDSTFFELKKLESELGILVLQNEVNQGKGESVKKGMIASRFEVAMFLDADLAIPIEELKKFIESLESGFDIVIASRFVPGLRILKPVLWYRKIMEKIFRLLRMIIINNWDIQDTQCGFKVFRREAALKIFPLLTVKRFSFDAEALFIGKKKGFKIKELPISLQNPRTSHIRLIRDSINMFMDLIRIRRNSVIGRYNIK